MAISINNLQASASQDKIPAIKYRIYCAKKVDIDWDKWDKAANGVVSKLPILVGKCCSYIDCQANSVKPNAATVGEVAPQGQLTISCSYEGITPEALQFIYNNNGEEFVVIWENCLTGKKFIAGSPCSCLKLSYESLGVIDDWQGANLKFVGAACPDPFWFFEGDIPLVPVAEPEA